MQTKSRLLLVKVLILFGIILLIGSCSLFQSSATISVSNNTSSTFDYEVDGTTKRISSGGTRSWTVTWNGMGTEDFLVRALSTSTGTEASRYTVEDVSDGETHEVTHY